MSNLSKDVNLRKKLKLFSIATGSYQASRMFCSAIDQIYLLSLGFAEKELFNIYAFHSLAFGILNIPIAVFADTFSRKLVVLTGIIFVTINFLIYSLLPLIQNTPLKTYSLTLIYLAHLIYGIGRQSVTLALSGLIINQIPKEKRTEEYSKYSHASQSYTTILSIISGTIGILVSYYIGYAYSFLLCFSSLILTLGLFIYIISISKDVNHTDEQEIEKNNIKLEFNLIRYIKLMLVKGKESLKEISNSSGYGFYVLAGTILVALSRFITYHFWQASLFGNKIKISKNLPTNIVIKLILYNVGMYLSQFLMNRRLNSEKTFSNKYYKKSHITLIIGSISALYLALGKHDSYINEMFLLVSFSLLQGAVGSLQVIQENLYACNLKANTLTSCISMLQFTGRFSSSISSKILSYINSDKSKVSKNFIIPALSLILFSALLMPWKNSMKKKLTTQSFVEKKRYDKNK